jgi:hypothetical protein
MWRNDVPCIAENEQFSRLGLRQQIGIDTGVRAGNEQRFRRLPIGKSLEQLALRTEERCLKVMKSVNELLHINPN